MSRHRVKLVVGDWSGDGHDKSEDVYCNSNKPLIEVEAAYGKGCQRLGFDLIKDYCEAYEDDRIENSTLEALAKALPSFGEEWNLNLLDDDEGYYRIMSTDEWVDLVLTVARIGDPELQITVAPHEGSWKVGGYGLFW